MDNCSWHSYSHPSMTIDCIYPWFRLNTIPWFGTMWTCLSWYSMPAHVPAYVCWFLSAGCRSPEIAQKAEPSIPELQNNFRPWIDIQVESNSVLRCYAKEGWGSWGGSKHAVAFVWCPCRLKQQAYFGSSSQKIWHTLKCKIFLLFCFIIALYTFLYHRGNRWPRKDQC